MQEWRKYVAHAGSDTPIWHWRPAYGGGYMVNGRLPGHLIDCDSARAYHAKS